MSSNSVVFKFVGLRGGDDHLDVDEFADKIQEVVSLLKQSTPPESRGEVSFKIKSISYSSPLNLECEVQSKEPEQAQAVVNCLRDNLDFVRAKSPTPPPDDILSTLESLAAFKKNIAQVEILLPEQSDLLHPYVFDDYFREKTKSLRAVEGELKSEAGCMNSVCGILEKINIHDNANTFRLYPSLPAWKYVDCKFLKEHIDAVGDALNKNVSVYGECLYRHNANFPYLVKVHSMEILPAEAELHSIQDLRGIAPDITDGLSSEEYIRRERAAWDEES